QLEVQDRGVRPEVPAPRADHPGVPGHPGAARPGGDVSWTPPGATPSPERPPDLGHPVPPTISAVPYAYPPADPSQNWGLARPGAFPAALGGGGPPAAPPRQRVGRRVRELRRSTRVRARNGDQRRVRVGAPDQLRPAGRYRGAAQLSGRGRDLARDRYCGERD